MRGGKIFRLVFGVGDEQVHRDHDMRFFAGFGGLEIAAVELERGIEVIGREMAGEGVGQPELGGELRPEQARPEHPELRFRTDAGSGLDGGFACHQRDQFGHVLREHFRRPVQVLAQRALQFGAGSRRAAQPQVDPAGEQRIQRAELFGDLERRVVGQHDPARSDADRGGRIADMREHDRSRSPGNALHCMVFGNPEPLAARVLGRAGERGRGGKGIADRAAFADGDEIEYGKIGHVASCSR